MCTLFAYGHRLRVLLVTVLDDGDAALGRIARIINFSETLISKTADLRPLVGPDSVGLHEAAGGMGAVGGKLQKTILFCRSTTLAPISKPSRMSRQISGSFKGGMTFAKQYCYLSIGRTAANFRWGRAAKPGFWAENARKAGFAMFWAGWHFMASPVARECHLQNSARRLIFPVSSSGGGLPGRLDLERDSRRSLFL
jgi:hypothetical protein